MCGKRVPTLETVGPRNEKLRVGKRKPAATLACLRGHLTGALFDFSDGALIAALYKFRQVGSGETDNLVKTLVAPIVYGVGFLGSGYLNEFFRPFHVICEIGTCR